MDRNDEKDKCKLFEISNIQTIWISFIVIGSAKAPKVAAATGVFDDLKTGNTVFVQGGGNTPRIIIEGIIELCKSVGILNITIIPKTYFRTIGIHSSFLQEHI